MIHYLQIDNFGPLREMAEINFEAVDIKEREDYVAVMPDGKKLLKLAYIYGANASGKTTVLKAFEFLRKLLLEPMDTKGSLLNFEPFLFCDNPYEQPSRFELSFYMDKLRYVYEVIFTRESILEEIMNVYRSAKPTELFTRSTDQEKRISKIKFSSSLSVAANKKELLESHVLQNNTLLGAFTKTNIDIPELEALNRWFTKYLLGMINSSNNLTEFTAELVHQDRFAQSWLDEFMNKADRQISKVQVEDETNLVPVQQEDAFPLDLKLRFSEIKRSLFKVIPSSKENKFYGWLGERKIDFVHSFEGDRNYMLPIHAESSGTKRFFGLGGLIFKLAHGSHLLCIDELETSLHADLMIYFLQVFLLNSDNSQLLITTHNLSLLDNTDFLRRDALWFSEKQKDGSSVLYSAQEFDSTTLRKDASLIKAYRAGKLGAKPNIGSPFITINGDNE
ncbi:MAG: ATP-binding protein [Chitinophagaceae bacterium]|jgi:AAA15 family ATPase/GTPase|nr:ATP-binding protein [Chitinophagaceae bacterium]MCA6446701.1 ATP-binding protein [Chitinophagaceae bacterium]